MVDFSDAVGVGIPWYSRDQYPDIIRIMVDGHTLPPSFDKWLERAEEAVALVTAEGGRPVRVELDADTFPAWCRARGLNVDRDGRHAFASDPANWPAENKH